MADWIKSIPLDPSKFRFDIEIYVPNPDDVVIAPERVWRDDIFTYIDLGEKAPINAGTSRTTWHFHSSDCS